MTPPPIVHSLPKGHDPFTEHAAAVQSLNTTVIICLHCIVVKMLNCSEPNVLALHFHMHVCVCVCVDPFCLLFVCLYVPLCLVLHVCVACFCCASHAAFPTDDGVCVCVNRQLVCLAYQWRPGPRQLSEKRSELSSSCGPTSTRCI